MVIIRTKIHVKLVKSQDHQGNVVKVVEKFKSFFIFFIKFVISASKKLQKKLRNTSFELKLFEST